MASLKLKSVYPLEARDQADMVISASDKRAISPITAIAATRLTPIEVAVGEEKAEEADHIEKKAIPAKRISTLHSLRTHGPIWPDPTSPSSTLQQLHGRLLLFRAC